MLCPVCHHLGLISSRGVLSGLTPADYVQFYAGRPSCYRDLVSKPMSNIDYWLLAPNFIPQQFGTICENDNFQLSIHLHSHLIPRPSASSHLDYQAHPMANTSQAPDLEGLHCEMHDIAEQIRIMNENNSRLIQYLTANNPPPPPSAPVPEIQRSRRSHDSNDDCQNDRSTGRARDRRRRSLSRQHRQERSPVSLEFWSSRKTPKVKGREVRRRGRVMRTE
ncbi:hypothetical protein Acr_12g0001080 [Actinidia rufa]|uniref:RING/U-box superfamily protein n=1 Tax=Actinidia rufa TaxID=165716 RepID=A0A7J0FI45_9ERIC|nr:hypothetical protein Acr_12g0001080 [Actinidia rufa]